MAAPTVTKKSRPKFKLEQFRDTAIESRGMEVGVDVELDAGTFDPREHATIADTSEFIDADVVTVEEGDSVYVPHPLMLSDERQEAFETFQRGDDLDQEEYTNPDTGLQDRRTIRPATIEGRPAPSDTYRMAANIIGERELWRLRAGGGHSNDVALAWQFLTREGKLDAPKPPTPRR